MIAAPGDISGKTGIVSKADEFSKLYDEFMPKVYRYIFYRVRRQQLTEDLTSEVFEKAFEKYAGYDSRRASFSTWIFTIARNTLIDSYKTGKESRQAPLDEADEIASSEPGPEEAVEDSEEKARLVGCVSSLPEREQEIIRLKFGARMNNREISKLMGLSESNVGTILDRSLGKLRVSLGVVKDG
jgi:RNA polymerase sigma factor (sigma-70 family)